MDVPQEIEGQKAVDRDAVEARPVGVIMRHDRTDEDLQQQDSGDDEKVFADPALARRQRSEPRKDGVHRRLVGIVQIALIDE
jgi:hypothetical protein